jgi:uncharacterized protein DUF4372
LTFRESLRDIEVCLRAQSSKLYHLGIRSAVARNTLANANAVRDWRIYADFAQSLIGIARPLVSHWALLPHLRSRWTLDRICPFQRLAARLRGSSTKTGFLYPSPLLSAPIF